MSCVALVPARGGSTGIKDKNLQKVAGETLVAKTIRNALEAGFEDVYILSDSEAIRAEGRVNGAIDSIKRPESVSGSVTHMFEVYKWFFTELAALTDKLPDYFCTMLATTPFRSIKTISEARESLLSKKYDWVLSVNEFEHHPYRAMKLDNKGLISPQFDVPQSVIWSNRQELPKMYRFNGGIIAGKVKHIMENEEYNIGFGTDLKIKPIFMTKEESVDIDDPIDLELCRLMAGDYGK